MPRSSSTDQLWIWVTSTSRLEKCPYIVGRNEINNATRPRPIIASTMTSRCTTNPSERSKPSVVADDPASTSACSYGRVRSPQKMALNPSTTPVIHTKGNSISEVGV